MNFSDLYNQSINDKQAFWGEQAKRIYWHQQPTQILDDSKPVSYTHLTLPTNREV